jgi:hypothetical protein
MHICLPSSIFLCPFWIDLYPWYLTSVLNSSIKKISKIWSSSKRRILNSKNLGFKPHSLSPMIIHVIYHCISSPHTKPCGIERKLIHLLPQKAWDKVFPLSFCHMYIWTTFPYYSWSNECLLLETNEQTGMTFKYFIFF